MISWYSVMIGGQSFEHAPLYVGYDAISLMKCKQMHFSSELYNLDMGTVKILYELRRHSSTDYGKVG